jgi:hypothetical protein
MGADSKRFIGFIPIAGELEGGKFIEIDSG